MPGKRRPRFGSESAILEVSKEFVYQHEIKQVGAGDHTEWWIPAEDLEALNDHIVGKIEVIGEYREG